MIELEMELEKMREEMARIDAIISEKVKKKREQCEIEMENFKNKY